MEFIYRTADRRNGNLIKRTKSFWKFGKSDDEILEGMAMWRHRDLVQTDNEKSAEKKRDATLKKIRKKSLDNGNTMSTNSSETLKNGQNGSKHDLTLVLDEPTTKYPMTKSDIDQRISMQQQEEHIYGHTEMQPKPRSSQNVVSRSKLIRQSYIEMEQENNGNNHNGNGSNNNVSPSKSKRSPQPQTHPQPQAHPQPQVRTSKSAAYNNKKSNNNSSKQTSNTKMSSGQDIIEYYDTRDLDTLKKRKHNYADDGDLEDSSLIITANTGRHDASDANFFDDESVTGEIVMKTVNRQEILKQYYSSGTDTERLSASSSDPYDCIVVEDHLVRKENEKNKSSKSNPKMEFSTFRGDDKDSEQETSRTATLLPRTKLTKTSSKGSSHQSKGADEFSKSNGEKRERRTERSGHRNSDHGHNEHERSNHNNNNNNNRHSSAEMKRSPHLDTASNKSYGPWYDLWGRDASVNLS